MEKSVSITGVREAIGELAEVRALLSSSKPMQGIVDGIVEEIKRRTATGKDYMGRNFKPYSKEYAKKKGKTRPDLRISGTMLDSIKAEVHTPQHGKVIVQPNPEPDGKILADQLAQIHNDGEGKQPQREFMNVNETVMNGLVKKNYDDPILTIVRKSSLRGEHQID